MKIATKDLKDEALLWAAVSVVWPNDCAVTTPEVTSKNKLIGDYSNFDIIEESLYLIDGGLRETILSALVQAKLGEFVDVPDHLV